jgi:hypothetical protein
MDGWVGYLKKNKNQVLAVVKKRDQRVVAIKGLFRRGNTYN